MAALLSLFGILAFQAAMLPAEAEAPLRRRLRRFAISSAGCALALGIAWFLAEAAAVAGTAGLAGAIRSAPALVEYLRFGQLLLARLALLAAMLVLLTVQARGAAFVLAAIALGIQPFLAHAAEVAGGPGDALIAAELVHLAAAGTWLGGLIPLLLCLLALPRSVAVRVLRRFSSIGLVAVLALAATGVGQAWVLAGGPAGIIGTPYGRIALLKVALLAVALAFAALNGLVLTSRLARPAPANARRALWWSVCIEAVVGCVIVLVAGWLASTAPGAMAHL
jgi:putative copper export protein